MKKVKGSALLSSVLVLVTCLLFLRLYLQVFQAETENEQLIREYLQNE